MTLTDYELRSGTREYAEGARERYPFGASGNAYEFHWTDGSDTFHHRDADCLSGGDHDATEDAVREMFRAGEMEPCGNCLSHFRKTRGAEETHAAIDDAKALLE